MTRRSKKLRDRSVCPKRRGGKRIPVKSSTENAKPRPVVDNAVTGGLSSSLFVGKIS